MSYQERRAIVSALSSIIILVVYSLYMLERYPDAAPYSAEIFRFWGSFLLLLIPISIVARIIIIIVFSIVNTLATRIEEPDITDERDKLIELRASRNALYVFSIGFLLAMAAIAIEQTPSIMFILLIGAGFGADVVSELSQFFYYRRGF